LNFFFELYGTNNTILKAWGFLGIYHILEGKSEIDEETKDRLQKIIVDLLKERNEIKYYGGSVETKASLREHHVRRLVELNHSFIFDPVLEYVRSFNNVPDDVVLELLEQVLSKSSDPSIEEEILRFSNKINDDEVAKKIPIVKSFGNLGQKIQLNHKKEIKQLFKSYLNYHSSESEKVKNLDFRIRELKGLIFEVGSLIDLDLEVETLEFVRSLKNPYNSLNILAEKYKKNKEFQSILLDKLNQNQNPHFIVEILKAIAVIKDNISNWQEIVIDNVMKYQINDADLIEGMREAELINEDLMTSFLKEAKEWSLLFLREFLIQNPSVLNEWTSLKSTMLNILQTFNPSEHYEVVKIKFILSLIIDLELKDFLEYNLELFKKLEDEELKKMTIFPILKFGEESLLLKLKDYIKSNQEAAKFVMRFLNKLERNDWRFYY
jgi:hypothetical protein